MSSDDLLMLLPGLRSGRPDPVRRFFNAALPPVRAALRRHFPIVPIDWVHDAATDALLWFRDHPERFHPERASLLTYLVRIGRNHLIDKIRQQRREREISVGGSVALEIVEAHNYQETQPETQDWQNADTLPREVEHLLTEILPDATDREILDMCLEGRHPVSDFAALLGIEDLPLAEQKRQVKRARDRVLKKVQRRRQEFGRLLFDG